MRRPNVRNVAPSRKAATKVVARDALKLLRDDHEAVSALLERYEKLTKRGTAAQKAEVARKICTELTVHATIEEEIFYSARRGDRPDYIRPTHRHRVLLRMTRCHLAGRYCAIAHLVA